MIVISLNDMIVVMWDWEIFEKIGIDQMKEILIIL